MRGWATRLRQVSRTWGHLCEDEAHDGGKGEGKDRLWVGVDGAHWTVVDGMADRAGRVAHCGRKQERMVFICSGDAFWR